MNPFSTSVEVFPRTLVRLILNNTTRIALSNKITSSPFHHLVFCSYSLMIFNTVNAEGLVVPLIASYSHALSRAQLFLPPSPSPPSTTFHPFSPSFLRRSWSVPLLSIIEKVRLPRKTHFPPSTHPLPFFQFTLEPIVADSRAPGATVDRPRGFQGVVDDRKVSKVSG